MPKTYQRVTIPGGFMKRITAILLIIIGILTICYPKLSESYYMYKQKEIMKNLDLVYENPKENSSTNIADTTINLTEKKTTKKEKHPAKQSADSSCCTIKIEKINLYQPVLDGATKEHLNISVASVNKKVKPGQIGNYAVAGHRSHTYGRNFNRLDELEAGDTIEVFDGTQNYIYTISEKYTVKPEDTWVLNSTKDAREITLLTCTPLQNPTGRLIIKGKLN